MTEFMVKLSDLRDASAQMRQSHQTITQSVNAINSIINELHALGAEEHQLTALGRPDTAPMNTYTDRLSQFATRLETTADDVEIAINQEFRIFPHFDLSLLPDENQETTIPPELMATSQQANAPLDTGDLYISPVNKDIFLRLQEKQTLLNEQVDQRALLMMQRDNIASDLEATRNRALAHNPDLDLNSVPRIQAIEADIAQLDAQIATYDTNIADLQSDANSLDSRLARVQPTVQADFELITQLETNPTNPHVVANTYDCVNHVVQKLPVPANMAFDAHLWNDIALAKPEFGITIGDTPLEGAVIVLEREHAYADDVFGHLLYVESVQDGEIWVTDNYNLEPVRFSDLTDELNSENVNYLYFPWHTRA